MGYRRWHYLLFIYYLFNLIYPRYPFSYSIQKRKTNYNTNFLRSLSIIKIYCLILHGFVELISVSSKGEILVFLNRTMESVSHMDCGILFQAIGPVYQRPLLVYSNFSFCIWRSLLFLVLYFDMTDLSMNLFCRPSGQS